MRLITIRSYSRFRALPPSLIVCAAIGVVWISGERAQAQTAGFGAVGGVYIDPAGMLRETSALSEQDLRSKLSTSTNSGALSSEISAFSPLRKISLRRLEEAIARFHESQEAIPAEYRFLAGLTDVRYVLIYPETEDVVLAGAAEGWQQLPSGDFVGRRSRRPVLQLEDLIVALRYAFTEQDSGSFLGCSIEPTAQGVKAHAAFVRGLAGMNGSQVSQIVQGMEQAVGPQDIHVYGIEPTSRFALQMVAADYRLKRIALAHDPSPVQKLPSYLDLAEKSINGGPQRQHRWWFVGHYDAIRHSADQLAFEFEGAGLKVETARSLGDAQQAKNADKPSRPAKLFSELASKHIPALAEKIPAVAELQNLVGLAVASVLIRRQAEGQVPVDETAEPPSGAPASKAELGRWRPRHFLNRDDCPLASLEVPRQTPSLANVRFVKNQFWLFSVSGGVEIDPARLVDAAHLKPAPGPKLAESRQQSAPPADNSRWWWD